MVGLIVDEGVVVEIVTPGTGQLVADGDVGEVVVTTLNRDYPLIRFATGDLSSVLPGMSPCGRTNMRITGWKGRADQTAKVRGMFIRPEQVAQLVDRHTDVIRARQEIGRSGEQDTLDVRIETADGTVDESAVSESVRQIFRVRGRTRAHAGGGLPNDGKVIDDRRRYNDG